MSLATNCPHCRATFKVAPDQLKIHAGLVRCGICQRVFDGVEHLNTNEGDSEKISHTGVLASELMNESASKTSNENVDNDSPAQQISQFLAEFSDTAQPIKISPALPPTLPFNESDAVEEVIVLKSNLRAHQLNLEIPVVAANAAPSAAPDAAPDAASIDGYIDGPIAAPATHSQTPTAEPPSIESSTLHKLIQTPLQTPQPQQRAKPHCGLKRAPQKVEPAEPQRRPHYPAHAVGYATDNDDLEQLPFIRQANHKKKRFWLFFTSVLLLSLLLIGQSVYVFRDLIAVQFPASKSTLIALCQYARCQIQLPMQLNALSYQADELLALPTKNTFEFNVTLYNQSDLTQAWPHIELTLKDPQQQVVLKRAFAPAEYLHNQQIVTAGFAAKQERAVKLYFKLDRLQASDYGVKLFYP